jgi:hypothetical protein
VFGGVVMDAFETSNLILKLFGGTVLAIAYEKESQMK